MQIKILQWNVWYKEDPKKIADEIKKIGADIICGQEFFQKGKEIDTPKAVAENLGFEYFYAKADTWDNRTEKDNQGNAIFSRFPIIGKKQIHVQDAKHNPPDAQHEGRVYLEAEIEVGDKKLNVATTHLSYSHKFEISKHRKKEVDKLIDILKTKKDNFVFGADLNSIPSSYTIKEIDKHLNNAGPSYTENTWPTKPFDYHGFKENDLNWRLDYLFTTKDVKVVSAEIVKTNVSDHLPILIVVEI